MSSRAVVRLLDGTPLTPEHFSFRDELRRITPEDRHGIALAWSECANTPKYSIVLVKFGGIIARALVCQDVSIACKHLETQLSAYHDRKKRFFGKITAVLNFSPNQSEAMWIAGTGADALFIPMRTNNEDEDRMIERWLGRFRPGAKPGEKDGLQHRAIVMPHK